jgi:predicted phage terminase large subunit-like protein
LDIGIEDIFRDYEGVLNGLSDGQRLRLSLEAEREMGKRSTYYLAKYILGYDKLSTQEPYFHQSLCRFYDKHLWTNQFHLHPRKHYKTTLITIAGKIRLALLDPNTTICIIANSLHNSTTFLAGIRSHFIQNDKFRELYPEHAVDAKRDEGTVDRFTTPARTVFSERSSTFEAASADRAIVSRHYKILNFDDFVDDKNTATPELRRKLYENYATSLATTSLTKNGRPWHHIVGTRWAFDDPYATILEDQKRDPQFQLLITQAYWKERDANGTKVTKYLFPEQFPPEALDSLKNSQKAYRFSCMYLNNPVPEGELTLDPAHLMLFNPRSRSPEPGRKIITVDPSTSVERRLGDPTVIGVYEMDAKSNIYILDLYRDWINPDEIIDRIILFHKLHQVREVAVEGTAFQRWLQFYIDKRKKEEGFHFNVTEIRRSPHVNKQGRLERIQPFLHSGRIFAKTDEPLLEHIKRELREYPYGRYDDFLDTLADAIERLKPPAPHRPKAPLYREPPVVIKGVNFRTAYTYRGASAGHGR